MGTSALPEKHTLHKILPKAFQAYLTI